MSPLNIADVCSALEIGEFRLFFGDDFWRWLRPSWQRDGISRPCQIDEEVGEFHDAVVALEAEGIVLRDVRTGLVDFPAQASSGRGYWLCWIVGEPEVAWWHWPEDGFAGRTPLSQPPD